MHTLPVYFECMYFLSPCLHPSSVTVIFMGKIAIHQFVSCWTFFGIHHKYITVQRREVKMYLAVEGKKQMSMIHFPLPMQKPF